jgi:hypothetical protein
MALGVLSLVVLVALVEGLIRVGVINRFIVPMPPTSSPPFRALSRRRRCCTAFCSPPARFSASILVTIFGVGGGVLLYRYHLLRLATETWVAAIAAAPWC